MTPEQFTYWLQGFFELSDYNDADSLNQNQVQIIKDHLKLVFDKQTPERQSIKYSKDPIGKETKFCCNTTATDDDYKGFKDSLDGSIENLVDENTVSSC